MKAIIKSVKIDEKLKKAGVVVMVNRKRKDFVLDLDEKITFSAFREKLSDMVKQDIQQKKRLHDNIKDVESMVNKPFDI